MKVDVPLNKEIKPNECIFGSISKYNRGSYFGEWKECKERMNSMSLETLA